MKKYKLTSESVTNVWGTTLFRIEALVSFGNVSKGEKGGFIEKEDNLDNDLSGNAWVYEDARVFGDARVYGNAQVFGDARVYGNAQVFGDAQVYGNAQVSEDARVFGDAQVYGDARVYGNARVFGDARVYGKIKLTFGYFFGWRKKQEELTFIDSGGGDELIGKRDCKFEYYEEENDDATQQAIKLLQENGYKIVKEL